MSQTNQAKYLPHFNHVHRSNFRFKIGFELWEILTMLTIVLSIASGLIWFNSLRPKSLDNEFVFVEKEKTALYNRYKATKSISEVSFNTLPDSKLSQTCYSDISNSYVNTSDYDQKLSQLADIKQQIEISKFQSQNNLSNVLDVSGLANLHNSFSSYVDQLKISMDQEYEFTTNVLSLKQDVSVLCQSSFSEVSSMSKNILTKLDHLSTLSDNKDADSWIQRNQNFISNLQKISADDYKISFENDIKSIQGDFITIFATTPNLESGLQNVSDSELESSFKNLENWEINYVNQNSGLDSKIVKIYN